MSEKTEDTETVAYCWHCDRAPRAEGQILCNDCLEEAASELADLGLDYVRDNVALTRLIVEKIRVSEQNPERAAFMKTLMGIQGAGIGEEVADAIANWLTDHFYACHLSDLLTALECEAPPQALELQSLRNGKRRIGPAAVARLRAALGC